MQSQTLLPIQRIYWDTLQTALNAEVKRLAREVARTLHQPEQPLLQAIQQRTTGAYLFEEAESELCDIQRMRCKYIVPSLENPSVLCECRQPILLGAGNACPTHLHKESPNVTLPRLRIIKSSFGENFWVDDEHIIRRKGDLKPIGKYNVESKHCILFQIDE